MKLDKSRLRTDYITHLPTYEAALAGLQQSIRHTLEQQGLTPTIRTRIKRFEPYFDKIRKAKDISQEKLSDFFGLRIICPFLADVDTVEQILLESCPVLEVERKA